MFSALSQATGKVSKMYTQSTILMGLRPLRGRKPMNMVMCVYMFDTFPVAWNRSENIVFLNPVCLFIRFPIPGALPSLQHLNPEWGPDIGALCRGLISE